MKKNLGISAVLLLTASLVLVACAKKEAAPAASSGAAAGTLKIGALFPLSGSVAYYGTEEQKGLDIAVADINAAGGLLGQQVKIVYEDTEGDSGKAVNAFTKLVTQDGIKLIVGPTISSESAAVAAQAQARGILMNSPSGTAVNITDPGDYVFRACFLDPFQGTVGADFAYDTLKVKNAAVLYNAGGDYQTGLAQAFKDEFARKGGKIVADEAYQDGDVDFNAQITRIKAAKPDAIWLPNYYNDVLLQAKQLRAQGVTVPLLGGDGWDSLTDNAGDEIMPGYWASGFAADTTEPKGAEFAKKYQTAYGKAATQFAALGYDAFMLIVDACKAANSTDPAKVKEALKNINGTYVTGNIRYDANRNPIKPATILEIAKADDGKLVNKFKTMVQPQ
ncbi:MAG: ABC transporter substrate-binding protein [Spirochaetaceae bacterium]|nr:ABC transporter substrate-binding protein [Spirochaetaceae bacterium]